MADAEGKQIVVLGAGFAGLYTALHLAKTLRKEAGVEITLIDQNHYHLFTPLLHEVATGVIPPSLILAPIRRVLRDKRVRFVRAHVEAIDLESRTVTLCRTRLSYDILVVALGSVTDFYGLDSVRERALEIKTITDADRLRCQIVNCFEGAAHECDPERRRELLTFVVVGGGCTGVETVTELHQFLEHLCEEQYAAEIDPQALRTLLVEAQDRVLPLMGRSLSRRSVRRMQEIGIEVMLNVVVAGMNDQGLYFADGSERLPAATVIWAAGVRAHPLVEALPLEKDAKGRVMVGPTLQALGRSEVYVLGDAAHARQPSTKEIYPPTAQVAYRQARVAAANIAAGLLGGTYQPFDFTYIGDLVSLGHLSGVADPFGITLRGLPAWLVWKFYYLVSLVGWQNRLRVALNWLLALLFPVNSSMPSECPPDCRMEHCTL